MIRILCLGRLDWTLGSEYLLLAMRGLLDRGVAATLRFGGDGPERDRVLFGIDDLQLSDVVQIVSREGSRTNPLASLFQQANVFALTPLDDSPRPEVRAALAAGLPGVWGQRTDAAAPVQHEVNGICVPPRDPEALCNAFARLSTDAALLARLSNGARGFSS